MHTVIVLDQTALLAFRSEHPWLDLSHSVSEVTIHLNEEGGPRKMTASRLDSEGRVDAADVDAFGSDVILALLAFAPRGATLVETQPELEKVWQIIDNLPRRAGSSKLEDVQHIEAERKALLEKAFSLTRALALRLIGDLGLASEDVGEARRLEDLAASLPLTLDAVRNEQKPAWSQFDLWGVVAVLRDELELPVDQDLDAADENSYFSRESLDAAAVAAMSGPIVEAMFDLSPCALCLSSLGGTRSRYIRVNQAYLDLVGKTWDQIRGNEMLSTGIIMGGEARSRRLDLLDHEGGYVSETAEIVSATGERVRVTISARRVSIAGQLFDFEIMTPATLR